MVEKLINYSLEKNTKFEEVTIGHRQIKFPIEYSDQLRISASYMISSEKAKKVLPSKKLEPIEVKPGISLLAIEALEFKKSGLKPYNEFGTFISVNYRRSDGSLGEPGWYCLHLPVTTEWARWLGVSIYGFPKIVADIEFNHTKDSSSCIVWHDGKTIAELSVRKLETKIIENKSISYTYKDGNVLKTLEESEGHVGVGNAVDGTKIILGDHKFADELRELGLVDEAIEYQFTSQMYSLLHKPSERLPA